MCGWGRVGRTIAQYLEGLGQSVVVVDSSEDRLEGCTFPAVCGDATSGDSLDLAGVSRAKSVVAAVADNAENLFIVVSARALRPDLFIVARIRSEQNETKMLRAGADRVVNPQQIGGARMAAFVHQPHVAEFLDVVMHDGSLEFRLADDEPASEYDLVGRGCADRSWYRGATRRAPICCWHVSAGGRAAGVLP